LESGIGFSLSVQSSDPLNFERSHRLPLPISELALTA